MPRHTIRAYLSEHKHEFTTTYSNHFNAMSRPRPQQNVLVTPKVPIVSTYSYVARTVSSKVR